jgi:hypothetical protein
VHVKLLTLSLEPQGWEFDIHSCILLCHIEQVTLPMCAQIQGVSGYKQVEKYPNCPWYREEYCVLVVQFLPWIIHITDIAWWWLCDIYKALPSNEMRDCQREALWNTSVLQWTTIWSCACKAVDIVITIPRLRVRTPLVHLEQMTLCSNPGDEWLYTSGLVSLLPLIQSL